VKKIQSALTLAAALLIISPLLFVQPNFAQQNPHNAVIHAGHVLDVKSGKLLADQTIIVEDGKIVSVGDAASARGPADAARIDLPNATLLPGLIDAHTHLTSNPTFGYEELAISVPREALIGAKNARVTLNAGFTTVRNVGAGGYTDVALRDAINAGDIPGPRMLVSGPPLGITGGHCDNNLLPYEYHAVGDGVADGISGVQHKVRENIKYGSDLIKICATAACFPKATTRRLRNTRSKK
jgi:imidazolonepropionase-like amidohydrolase